MRSLLFTLCVVCGFGRLTAQTFTWQPTPGHTQTPIWPGKPPSAQPVSAPEYAETAGGKDALVAGKPWVAVENVSIPTMTVYPPKGANTGAAVVVFPGGGYTILAIDLEGTEVCDWLTAKGVTCVLLKYRVPGEKLYAKPAPYPRSGAFPDSPIALEDAQRTIRLVRHHAAQWHIDPHRIGVLGFSAGGHLVAATSIYFNEHLYPAVDAADQESCRPDFAIAIYPGHLSANGSLNLKPAVAGHIPHDAPATFLLQNEDDYVDGVAQSLAYYAGLKKAGVPVEMHLYAQGGHAFGLRRTKLPATKWPELVETWLATIGVLTR
ncbi:Acetyl esterase/lipase [Granulicella rosea]|uniref:Acetyl esterase/lipase n=1 Tax=Granulicella rosea TaxID=474952 RepID=A0A239LBY7_9BACT|nr:alpha/beta hydrolase [Granulicella rosea]SNT28146.1 Acetyl esterase/lipase [Granulicella rosea]